MHVIAGRAIKSQFFSEHAYFKRLCAAASAQVHQATTGPRPKTHVTVFGIVADPERLRSIKSICFGRMNHRTAKVCLTRCYCYRDNELKLVVGSTDVISSSN